MPGYRKYQSNKRDCAHVWASRSQPEGQSGNVFFRGKTIFSYGEHFPMGRFVDFKGKTCVLITTATYSSSTASHISAARSAVSDRTAFNVPHLYPDLPANRRHSSSGSGSGGHRENMAFFRRRLERLVGKYARARKNQGWHKHAIDDLIEEANAYAEFFDLKDRLEIPDDDLKTFADAQAERDKKRSAAERAKQKKQEAAELKRLAGAIAAYHVKMAEYEARLKKWLAGQMSNTNLGHPPQWPGPYGTEPERDYVDHIRFRGNKQSVVETSRGAVLEVKHCMKLLPLLRLKAAETHDFGARPVEVGPYRVTRMDEKTVTINCHHILKTEIVELAKKAGLWVEPKTKEKADEPVEGAVGRMEGAVGLPGDAGHAPTGAADDADPARPVQEVHRPDQ